MSDTNVCSRIGGDRARAGYGRRIESTGLDTLALLDRGRPVRLSFTDLMEFHAGNSPGGVAHAFKVLQRALPLLGRPGTVEGTEISVRTAFGGPGARDAFERVTRGVSGGRYVVDPELERPDLGSTRARFVFELAHRERSMTLALREGFVTAEFLELAGRDERTVVEEERLTLLKREMTERVMGTNAELVYDAAWSGSS